MKTVNKVAESRGMWHFERIGRPIIMYDQRTKYNRSIEEFDRVVNERKRHGKPTISKEQIGNIIVEEEL